MATIMQSYTVCPGSSRAGSLDRLLAAVAKAVERYVSEPKPQELANTAWAFATGR